jgi:uncharacterized protein YegJ (DUF2314 family)
MKQQSLEQVGYTLLNAEEKHTANPSTFKIPSKNQRESFQVGDRVQLMFEGLRVERMWVEVVDAVDGGSYFGELRNHPIFVTGVSYGDLIRFGPEHIIKYIDTNGVPSVN